MRSPAAICAMLVLLAFRSFSQVDTAFIYNPETPYGSLDIRIATSDHHYYYLEENKTFSFREINGVRTETYLDMTAWDSSPYQQGNMRERNDSVDVFVMNYRLLVPQSYDADYAAGYPLVILLHGAMERGNCDGTNCYHATTDYSPNANIPPAPALPDHKLLNNDYNLVHGGSNYLEAHTINGSQFPDDPALDARAFPGFVLFPQNLNGWNISACEDAIRLIRLISRRYNIDENRIYINGVSHGGHGAYEVMKRAPWLFAAAVLFSAADDAQATEQDVVSRIAGIPMWVFQGGKDKNPTPKKTERYVSALRDAGANVRFTLYPELGHGTWNKAFAEPDFFNWMLGQKKNDLHVFAGNPVICATSGTGAILALPDGYASYQWEYDGQLVEDADSAAYIANLPGSYRGRFSILMDDGNVRWNEWSEAVAVTEKDPSLAQVKQIGTVLLKDPNGNGDAILQAEAGYSHYFWYRDGHLLDFPGDQDDKISVATFNPSYGNGTYHVQVSGYDNCASPPSDEFKIFFDDSAPVNINPPTGLTAESTSPVEVALTWQDVSDNESGFELWRKRETPEERYGAWEMAALTSGNIVSFTDRDLLPGSTYHYMIRAVSDSGRSLYSPDTTGQAVIVATLPDDSPPSSPTDLVAMQVGVESVKLNWRASTDNSAVREYLVYYHDDVVQTGSNDTTFLVKGIDINKLYTFSVKAADRADNLSEASNTAEVYTGVDGLFYQHSTGSWESLDDIDWAFVEFNGKVNDFTLSPKTQEDFFNFRFDGYIHIRKDGVYQFRISSNDGSRLSLDDSLLVENDGVHNLTTVTGPIQILSAGPHRITVDFFDYVASDSLLVEYKGPDSGEQWVEITQEILTSEVITAAEPEVTNEHAFNVYPNPTTSSNINIEVLSNSIHPAEISVTSNTGMILYRAEIKGAQLKRPFNLFGLQKLQPGFYIIIFEQANRIVQKKIIIR